MYQNKLAVAIKHNGKILRENKDIVKLPFGSEFSVLVKNLNSRRVKFTLQIDGIDVLDGTEIIVDANSEVEMKRFIRNGNMNEGNAFKFIERTHSIEDGPRGIKVEDGIVRVEFWFEKELPEVKTIINEYHRYYYDKYYVYPYRRYYPYDVWYSSDTYSVNSNPEVKTSGVLRGMSTGISNVSTSEVKNDIGITVPGSKVEQKFQTVYGFNSETQSNVIVLRLVGVTGDDVRVEKAVTVKTKQKCTTCGKVNKATSKFCSSCGTGLELL